MRSIRGAQKNRLGLFVDSLSEDPFEEGDYSEKDETDRHIQVKVIGQYAVTFWSDHAVKEVKVVDVRRADRA